MKQKHITIQTEKRRLIKYIVQEDCTLDYTNFEAGEEIEIPDGDYCPNDWKGIEWFAQYPQIFEPVYEPLLPFGDSPTPIEVKEGQHTKWENELQSLKNALVGLNLNGYGVNVNHNGFRKKATYFLRDDKGTSITGSWSYEQLNHFILGYGKASNKLNADNEAFKESNRELVDTGSTILAVQALERMERYDIAERLKNALLKATSK